ncbi:MAG TPA: hypothetical protein VF661_04115 [Actinomycetales bacterium]|jgi:hypothetical protein
MTSAYSTHRTTRWAVNAKGDSYGIENDDGTPDLMAVATTTTTGRQGYVYARDLAAAQPTFTSPADALAHQETRPATPPRVPVCDADGTTVIGVFNE